MNGCTKKLNSGCPQGKRDLGKPTHTLVPCCMPKPLPPRNQCTGWFTGPSRQTSATTRRPYFTPNATKHTACVLHEDENVILPQTFLVFVQPTFFLYFLLLRSRSSKGPYGKDVEAHAMCPTLEPLHGGMWPHSLSKA